MGLMVHSLENIPESAKRDYYIYLLDYGWDEPISDALRRNFDQIAHESAISKAVIIKGTVGERFKNKVFHGIELMDSMATTFYPHSYS